MVGERESLLRKKETGKTDNDGIRCTYSRRKTEKKACKFAIDDNNDNNDNNDTNDNAADMEINEVYEHHQLVDKFVQEVIEKAKAEYIQQTSNAKSSEKKGGKRKKDQTNGQISQDKASKKSEKGKKKHHYKYSEPVDEREISAYEQGGGGEEPMLQWDPEFGHEPTGGERRRSSSFYNRTMATFRNLIGCCIGKT